MQSYEMALNDGKKPENFLADEENRQGYEQAYLLTEKVCSNSFS